MKFEFFGFGPDRSLKGTLERAQKSSDDALESIGAGFPFPVTAEIRKIPPGETVGGGESGAPIPKIELMKAALEGLKEAWEEEIAPRLSDVRASSPTGMKSGTDFFTEADTLSERRIRELFIRKFGEEDLRIFGEEANTYAGNPAARIGVRIDPVDGTESMKFGKPDWGIMVGVYEGTPESERQALGAVYMPERNALVTSVDGVGVFIADLETGETVKAGQAKPQDSLKNVVTHLWEHADVAQRGRTPELRALLVERGARVRSTASACSDVLEALTTGGNRILIVDGDFNQVDFIPLRFLEQVGYELYTWDGTKVRADDIALANAKFVAVPPGQAGVNVLEILKQVV